MGVSFEIGLFDYHLLLILLQVGKMLTWRLVLAVKYLPKKR